MAARRERWPQILQHIDWLGFDVDGTLAQYNLPRLAQQSFDKAVDVIRARFACLEKAPQRPQWHQSPHFMQRCITVDTSRGNFLLVGSCGMIVRAHHGGNLANLVDIPGTYPSCRVGPETSTEKEGRSATKEGRSATNSKTPVELWTLGDTVFAPLYAWLVDLFDVGMLPIAFLSPATPSDHQSIYQALADVAKQALAAFYRTDFEAILAKSPGTLLTRHRGTAKTLHRLRRKCRLFVVTNGAFDHCNAVMQYAVGPSWQRHFDIIVTSAKKATFFTSSTRRFTGLGHAGTSLHLGHAYSGGNADELHAFFAQIIPSARVAYVGDHPVEDMQLPTRLKWATIGIIPELDGASDQASTSFLQTWYRKLRRGLRRQRMVTPTSGLDPEDDQRRAVASMDEPGQHFFNFGKGGIGTAIGKRVVDATELCVPSVGHLNV